MLTICTTSHFPDRLVEHLVRWTLADREALDVVRSVHVTHTSRGNRGTAWPKSGRILVRLGTWQRFPLRVPEYRRGVPTYDLLDWQEQLVALVAHEARHCQQPALGLTGRGEEADAEHAAIATLLRFRAQRAEVDAAFAEVVAKYTRAAVRTHERAVARAERKARESTPAALRAAKLASMRERLARWTTRLRRARTALAKLDRSIRYHERAQRADSDAVVELLKGGQS